jgi:hypothetical protein
MLEFRHAGFICVTWINPLGIACGYVGVAPSSPHYGKEFQSLPWERRKCLSYSEDCLPGRKPDGMWWFGFDCRDYIDCGPPIHVVQRGLAFAEAECRRLADWLADRVRATLN